MPPIVKGQSRGYGIMRVRGKVLKTHRIAWELANGPIPDGLSVCHSCDNPPCCNVEHLFLGTHADNMADMIAKKRDRPGDFNAAKTHCPQGHPYDEANTIVRRNSRECRACKKLSNAKSCAKLVELRIRVTGIRGLGKYNSAKTHCPQGHEYAGSNLQMGPDGRRSCRICSYAAGDRYRARLREATKN